MLESSNDVLLPAKNNNIENQIEKPNVSQVSQLDKYISVTKQLTADGQDGDWTYHDLCKKLDSVNAEEDDKLDLIMNELMEEI